MAKEEAGVSTLIKRLVVMFGLPIICYLRGTSEQEQADSQPSLFFVMIFVYTKVCARRDKATSVAGILFEMVGIQYGGLKAEELLKSGGAGESSEK